MRTLLLLSAPLAVLTALGCNTSPEGGIPDTGRSFTLSGPTLTTTIRQGDTRTVTITVDRDSGFNQSVRLSVTGPKGIEAELDPTQLAAGDPKEVALTIRVAEDAALGDHLIKVTGTPDTGTATSVDVKITVESRTSGSPDND